MAKPKIPRDHALGRLKEITDLACRFAMENLPVRPADDYEEAMIRRQRVAINNFQTEAELIVQQATPVFPTKGDMENKGARG